MSISCAPTRRLGFSAIELLFVMGILMLLTAMAAPTALKSLRRTATRQAASAVVETWNLARRRAMNEQSPLGTLFPRHFGIVVHQDENSAWIGLIFDKLATNPSLLAVDGDVPNNSAGTGQPIRKFDVPASVVIATGDGALPLNGDLVIYAQYRTGQPISPDDVVAGKGHLARSVAAGVKPVTLVTGLPAQFSALAPSLTSRIRFQTIGYSEAPRRGEATQVAIYHAGLAEVFSP